MVEVAPTANETAGCRSDPCAPVVAEIRIDCALLAGHGASGNIGDTSDWALRWHWFPGEAGGSEWVEASHVDVTQVELCKGD